MAAATPVSNPADLAGLIEFIGNVSIGLIAMSGLASIFYLAAFGIGISKLGGSASMHDRAPEPKLVVAYLMGSILFGSFTYMLGVSYMTFYQEEAFTATAVWVYSQSPPSSSSVNLAAVLIRSVFQIMALFFLYGSFSKAVDAGRSDGRERGALSNAVFKMVAAVLLWTPEKTVAAFSFIPFFDVFARLLSGSTI
jgi:hypothetical protein